ncbi:MAG TPA: patatin-like phospholipase family protein [Bacteroidia bacterium]|nr:patatin-like phospholipase family protein [Bacteroidia bacterium]
MNSSCNLVLSGGGTRGYSHIGVAAALLEKGIGVSGISGASCGAVVGAFICDGFHPIEIEEILLKHEPELGFNYTRFWKNLMSFDDYTRILKTNLRSKTFEGLNKPLYVTVTDLNNGCQVIISKGNLLEALIATTAIPVLLPPCYINGVPYADGSLSNNLPVEPFLNTPEKIIGVHANPIPDFDPGIGMTQGIDRSLHLIMRNGILKNSRLCDVFIEAPDLKKHQLFESKKTRELVNIGYNHVMNKVDLSPLKK